MTNDYNQFMKMTKPLKFRRIRRMWNTFRDVIINSYYNLLYLLHIIEKVTIKDHTCRECATLKSDIGRIVTGNVLCDVQVKVVEHIDIIESHYKTKKGKLIPIYSEYKPTTEFIGMPVDLAFRFNDNMGFMHLNHDVIRVPVFEVEPVSFLDNPRIEPSMIEVHEIDTSYVRSIRSKQCALKYYAEIQDFMLETYYRRIVNSIEYCIKNINWDEYTRKEKC